MLAATDPGAALRRGAAVAQARREGTAAEPAPGARGGAYVVLAGAEPVSTSSPAAAGSSRSSSPTTRACRGARGARGVRHRRPRPQLSLERVDGEPVVGSRWSRCSSSSASARARASSRSAPSRAVVDERRRYMGGGSARDRRYAVDQLRGAWRRLLSGSSSTSNAGSKGLDKHLAACRRWRGSRRTSRSRADRGRRHVVRRLALGAPGRHAQRGILGFAVVDGSTAALSSSPSEATERCAVPRRRPAPTARPGLPTAPSSRG